MFSFRFKELAEVLASSCFTGSAGSIGENEAVALARHLLIQTRERNGIVYVIGNGGSAGIASHFSNDLMKALRIPSQTLYDSNLMTCLSNDIGYEHVFS